MVTKEILNQYTDLRQEVNEVRGRIAKTEKQIAEIEEDGPVVDKVMGGEGGWQSFRIEGFPHPEYDKKKTLLNARKAILTNLEMEIAQTINQVEKFISTVEDSQMRRIIAFRFIDGKTWSEVARAMGGGNNEDNIKQAFHRFMEKT